MSVYADDAKVAELTGDLVKRGYKVFHIFKSGEDQAHVANLLRIFDPPQGARILDAGCGVGEVSRLMRKLRPDLSFVLQNISHAQLKMCPWGYEKVHGRFESVPLSDATFDGVMFNYSLGHGDIDLAFGEAARLLKAGGVMLIYDMEGDCEILGYLVRPASSVIAAASAHGLQATYAEPIDADAEAFRDVMDGEDFGAMLDGISPIVYRFVKC